MPTLYVGNATKQYIDFSYRITESMHLRTQRIGIGQQVRISGDLSTPDVDYIIHQHEKYGLVHFRKIADHKEFSGLVYSVDAPIPMRSLEMAIEHNQAVLVQRGKDIRKGAAVAISQQLEQQLAEQKRPEGLKALEVSAVEEEPRGGYQTEAPIGEGIRVTRNEPETAKPKTRRGRRS